MQLMSRLLAMPESTTTDAALHRAESGVAVFWRPGCVFCTRLRRALRRHATDVAWVNIWQDPAGADFVASVNQGNQTVPTVVIDGVPHTNPDPRLVLAALGA